MNDSNFNLKDELTKLGLSAENSVIIGSGILDVLGIRESGDVDVVIDRGEFERLDGSSRFRHEESYGQTVLVDEAFEIRTSWGVLGKDYRLEDFLPESVVVDGVRYITPDFLLRVKKSWLTGNDVRQKDIEDVKLIEGYLVKEREA